MTGIPGEVRLRLRAALWQAADEMGWLGLKSSDRTKHYERWTRDPDVGGVLAHYMNQGKIRVYIKDSLLKGYGVQRVSDRSPILMSLNISMEVEILHSYSKPHGLLLRDQRLICWGRADDWKIVLMAAYERSYGRDVHAHGCVLRNSRARLNDLETRAMVQAAADRLGIEHVRWLED